LNSVIFGPYIKLNLYFLDMHLFVIISSLKIEKKHDIVTLYRTKKTVSLT